MKRVLSAIQPTGELHLGNYFGAVQNWVRLQSEYACTFGVVDYHSMTMPYLASDLVDNTWNMVHQLLACGVKPENLFIQSQVPEHTELTWILSCVCSYGEVSRMTQFKDKSDQVKEGDKDQLVSAGLFLYPILQAADILIYRADYVPVGKDQEQHLELSRNIAERFNRLFGKKYFEHPAPLFTDLPKVLSLANPDKKMSKSLGEKHFVPLFGEAEKVRKQVKSAVTDTGEAVEGMSPGVRNLFEILKASNKLEDHRSLLADYESGQLKYSMLKEAVAEGIIEMSAPFKLKLAEIKADQENVTNQILDSSAIIRKRAQETMRDVRELTGLPSLR